MNADSDDAFDQHLQARLNDLARLVALPLAWRGCEAAHVLASLLDTLPGMLKLDFAYARRTPLRDEGPIDVVRIGVSCDPGVDADDVRGAMSIWGGLGPLLSPQVVPNPVGEGDIRVASYRLGARYDLGLVVAASTRADFPTPTEALLLQVAVSQAVIGLQEAQHSAARDSELDAMRAEDVLRRAQAELTHVNRVLTMGELAASIAHEVTQPLAAVLTGAQACERWLSAAPPDIEEARASAQRVVRDSLRASEVLAHIRGLLAREEPVKRAVRMDELLRAVAALVQTEARNQQVGLRLYVESGLPSVLGDRVQLEQVVLNLAVNAIEAMRSVSARPRELQLCAVREEATRVRVSVRDTGPGLPAASRERIFDAFFTTKAQGMGMGMGLAISNSIVNAHGGKLWATPNEAGGETFHFTLPIAR